MFRSWFDLTVDTALLGLESQGVIALRLMHLGIGGPAAQVEANRMVSEKVAAFFEASALLAAGGSASNVVSGYRKHVGENHQRLCRLT